MIKTYIKIAWRNLMLNKGYSILNISGLAVGLTCFAFISFWVLDELSYDKSNSRADNIYRVIARIITQAESFDQAVTPIPLAPDLLDYFPGIKNAVRIDKSDAILEMAGTQYTEDNILATESSFFDIFEIGLLEGSEATALTNPYSAVLTESLAKKYFGHTDPIGKTLKLYLYDPDGEGIDYTITGIIPDASENRHFGYNMLVSLNSLEKINPEQFTPEGYDNNSYYTYLLLDEAASQTEIEKELPNFIKKYIPNNEEETTNQYILSLQPLKDIYLKSKLRYEIGKTGNLNNVFIFVTIGLFILILAGINYTNLATARSISRAKEVGVKKVLGASRFQLAGQQISESVLTAIFSFLLSIGLIALLKPLYIPLSEKELILGENIDVLVLLFGVSVFAGILSGLYPAFYITRFKAKDVVKGGFKSMPEGVRLRKGLVAMQFIIAIVLIVGIMVVKKQLNFIQYKDLGFDQTGMVALKVNGNSEVIENFGAFKNDLLAHPEISGITRSNSLIIGGLGNSGARTINGRGEPLNTGTYRLITDPEFIEVYGIDLLAGRNFYKDNPSDSASYILNESAVKAFGWASVQDAINKPFEMSGIDGSVVGVVSDFNFDDLQHPVDPIVLRRINNNFSQISIKANLENPRDAIGIIKSTWQKHFPGAFFDLSFIDERLDNQYQAEKKYSTFFLCFSILALMIACLGLLGLTAFSTQQRRKEISVRKILGADVQDLLFMLSIDFLKIILLAFVLAIPIGWYLMNKWLQNFAYRIDIDLITFLLAGGIAISIAILTIGFHALKASSINPVNNLRTE